MWTTSPRTPALAVLRDEQVAVALDYAAAADALDRHGDVLARPREPLDRHALHEPLHARFILAEAPFRICPL